MEVDEQDVPAHTTVQEGSGEKEMVLVSRGGVGGRLQGIQRLWAPPGDDDLLLIPGEGDLDSGQRLDSGGQEFFMSKGGVEEDGKNPQ